MVGWFYSVILGSSRIPDCQPLLQTFQRFCRFLMCLLKYFLLKISALPSVICNRFLIESTYSLSHHKHASLNPGTGGKEIASVFEHKAELFHGAPFPFPMGSNFLPLGNYDWNEFGTIDSTSSLFHFASEWLTELIYLRSSEVPSFLDDLKW